MKGTRQALLIFLSGEFPVKSIEGIRVSKEGIPIILGPLMKYVRSKSPDEIQLILTVLFCSRALGVGRDPDITTITSPSSLDEGSSEILDLQSPRYIRRFFKQLGYFPKKKVPSSLRWKEYHFTVKSGPNGHALYSSLQDLFCLPPELVSDIWVVGGKKIERVMKTLLYCKSILLSTGLPVEGKSFRKITWFPDMESKVRVIAIGDFWSQTVLKPLHHYIFRILRKIPQDCTFNQSAFRSKVSNWTEFHSIDLTAATDRFPISIIHFVLRGHLPEDYCNSWKRIMVGHPFDYKQSKISYSVGNPMGFYTSWASFALAHHYVMFYCCTKLNISWKEAKYVLLGDDILIGDSRLADKYKQVITSLGCSFSPLKTHDSKCLLEFAKRYVWNGKEITPFPVSAIKETKKRYYLLVALLCELSERGWDCIEGIPSAIESFYLLVLKRRASLAGHYKVKSVACERMLKFIRGAITADDCLNTIARHNKIPLRLLEKEESEGILQSITVEAFAESNPANQSTSPTGIPLGDFAFELCLKIVGIQSNDSVEKELSHCPEYIPQISAYGLIEQMYLNMTKEAFRIDTKGGGDWPLFLRAMALPLDDRIFVQRTSHLVSRSSAIFGDKVLARFKLFLEYYRKDFYKKRED